MIGRTVEHRVTKERYFAVSAHPLVENGYTRFDSFTVMGIKEDGKELCVLKSKDLRIVDGDSGNQLVFDLGAHAAKHRVPKPPRSPEDAQLDEFLKPFSQSMESGEEKEAPEFDADTGGRVEAPEADWDR